MELEQVIVGMCDISRFWQPFQALSIYYSQKRVVRTQFDIYVFFFLLITKTLNTLSTITFKPKSIVRKDDNPCFIHGTSLIQYLT